MYKNKIDKKINNSQFIFSTINKSSEKERSNLKERSISNNISIDQKIDNLFNSTSYIYKIDVNIVTDNNILKKRIVARNKNNLITIENEYIPISIIRDIYK